MPRSIEGKLTISPGTRFGIVAARFNHFIVEHLVAGAEDAIARHGGSLDGVVRVTVPGAWELPVAIAHLADSGSVDAIIALGAVIRGATPHFDYVAGEAAKGAAAVQLETGVPVSFGVLTTDTIEQAVERAGAKAGNKGFDAACTAIEMVGVVRGILALSDAGARTPSSKKKGRVPAK